MGTYVIQLACNLINLITDIRRICCRFLLLVDLNHEHEPFCFKNNTAIITVLIIIEPKIIFKLNLKASQLVQRMYYSKSIIFFAGFAYIPYYILHIMYRRIDPLPGLYTHQYNP